MTAQKIVRLYLASGLLLPTCASLGPSTWAESPSEGAGLSPDCQQELWIQSPSGQAGTTPCLAESARLLPLAPQP